jgi:AcrR family transcriptional regulator
MSKTDRRVQRTRELLQKSLIELISERGYDLITIQDIAHRANIGRTTFYLHYNSKDELFVSCHEAIVREFRINSLHPLSREELLSPEVPAGTDNGVPAPGRRARNAPIYFSRQG